MDFQNADPAHADFQHLEDLATAYWHSEVLFTAIDLEIFDRIENGHDRIDSLAVAAGCRPGALNRLMGALVRLELVHDIGEETDQQWCNSRTARSFLIPGSPDYLGDFLLYRRYMKPRWDALTQRVSREDRAASPTISPADDYAERTFAYVRAMDRLMVRKTDEIADLLGIEGWSGPVLDAGGGAGALGRRLARDREDCRVVLFDLPEVLEAARRVYPTPAGWERILPAAGDFRRHPFPPERFGLILMSNFLHAYGPETAESLLASAADVLKDDGLILIHDYFPDRRGRSPHKGPLYDLNMMLNTYDGQCHAADTVRGWLAGAGLPDAITRDLSTDTSVILAGKPGAWAAWGYDTHDPSDPSDPNDWPHRALKLGFDDAAFIPPGRIELAPWVRMKCRFGCDGYGKSLQCPPHAMAPETLRDLLACYSRAMIVRGSPPGKSFHNRLIDLEREAFLAGFHKALVFGAGPCPVCRVCPVGAECRHPKQARPSMEACGIDVYTTVRRAGFNLRPVGSRDGYVKYFGLLLME